MHYLHKIPYKNIDRSTAVPNPAVERSVDFGFLGSKYMIVHWQIYKTYKAGFMVPK